MTKKILYSSEITDEGIPFCYSGPNLDEGCLPAVFYFALSDKESLSKDPYNQPVQYLSPFPLRIFSLTLPCHDLGLSPNDSLKALAKEIQDDKDPIEKFLQNAQQCLTFLEKKKVINKSTLALMGLSRGGFIASHLAAREPEIRYLLQFAPLTKLSFGEDFKHIQNITSYDVHHLASKLYEKTIRIYMGNRDLRVGTKNAFSFCEELVEKAFSHHIRSSKVELRLFPSIGHQGHGTPIEIFNEGALWLANQLQ